LDEEEGKPNPKPKNGPKSHQVNRPHEEPKETEEEVNP
jgi:hypothetical protein